MDAGFAIAAVGWFLLAVGHATVGVRWVLPGLEVGRLPGTPFGPPSMTLAMLRFTWHIVTVLLVGFGALFALLAAADVDPKTLLLRWSAVWLLVATAMAGWQVRRRPSSILRLPVPVVFVAMAVLCWTASS